MNKFELEALEKRAKKALQSATNLKELDENYKRFLGKKGELSLILRSLKNLPKGKRVEIGKKANQLKEFLEEEFKKRAKALKEKIEREILEAEWKDVTMPTEKPKVGHLHPLTLTRRKIQEIFQSMGFSVVEGPEIENEWYNFDALNIPKDHPARDLWDTIYLKTQDSKVKSQKLLLRTHTSPVQIRYMEKNSPPLRIIVPGRVFRHEATDARHEVNFYQVEGLMVDKKGKVTVASFKAIMNEFCKKFFGLDTKIRLRPSYFPFTEPSFEIDVSCPLCSQKGCSFCKNSGWIETLGAGMVHPNVFKAAFLNPKEWSGFAFGMGMDRFAMIKYKINDIRLFYGGDLRFLTQF